MNPETLNALMQVCTNLHADDPDHVEGGCGDISTALFVWLKKRDPSWPVELRAGTAVLNNKHTHVWLEIDGEIFDPIAAATGWNYRGHRRAKTTKAEKAIIDLHTDPDIQEDWENTYERDLLENATRGITIPNPKHSASI